MRACVGFLCGGWRVRMCPTERAACARVCVSCVEGGMCVCVLPRGRHVRVCGFPMWRVGCAYVSYREGSMCARVWVSCVEGGVCVCVLPRGLHVHVCGFPMWRVACAYVSYREGGMCGVCVFPMFRNFMNFLALMWHTLNRYLTGEETWFQVFY